MITKAKIVTTPGLVTVEAPDDVKEAERGWTNCSRCGRYVINCNFCTNCANVLNDRSKKHGPCAGMYHQCKESMK